MVPFDIAQIMPLLQAQQAGQPGMTGALAMARPPMAGGPMAPDFNAMLQQHMMNMNADRQARMQERIAQFGQPKQMMQPVGNAQPMRPMGFQRPQMGASAPMVGTSQLGMQPPGNSGPAANVYPDRRQQNMNPLGG